MEILTHDILTEFICIICNSPFSINHMKTNVLLCAIYCVENIAVFLNSINSRIIGNFQQFPNGIPMKICHGHSLFLRFRNKKDKKKIKKDKSTPNAISLYAS